jgi:hypothetical protein
MLKPVCSWLTLGAVVALWTPAIAQPPARPASEDSGKKTTKDYSNHSLVKRMMAFNKKKDGKLTRDEITDRRLLRLFDMADTNKDGVVTREELAALAAKLEAENGPEDGRRGPRGFGGPRGGGMRGFGGPPQPGQILPPFLQERLQLTDKQKKQLAELQKEVDARLDKILTDEQKKQLKEMPRGFGRGGPRGPRPDGPPPEEDRRRE